LKDGTAAGGAANDRLVILASGMPAEHGNKPINRSLVGAYNNATNFLRLLTIVLRDSSLEQHSMHGFFA
jgi:hypothetical protein